MTDKIVEEGFFDCSFNKGIITVKFENQNITFPSPTNNTFPSPNYPTYDLSFNIILGYKPDGEPVNQPVNFNYKLNNSKYLIEITKKVKIENKYENFTYSLNFYPTSNSNLFDVSCNFPVFKYPYTEINYISGNFSILRNQANNPTQWTVTQLDTKKPNNFFNASLDTGTTYKFGWSWATFYDSESPLYSVAPIIIGASDILHKYFFPNAKDSTTFIGLAWSTQLITDKSL